MENIDDGIGGTRKRAEFTSCSECANATTSAAIEKE